MRTAIFSSLAIGLLAVLLAGLVAADDALPFQQTAEVFRDEKGEVIVFRVRLEQPFLADEFEKSNYLRLKSNDERAYLIYPKETRFQQKHAEFFGRLRGQGDVALQLSYEIISENPDGSRRVELRQGDLSVTIPSEAIGSKQIFRSWAEQQNAHFAHLLRYYPQESFFQYCLLQSMARYGVEPPSFSRAMPNASDLETDLYQFFTGSLAVQEALQYATLRGDNKRGDLTQHISGLTAPRPRSPNYDELLEKKRVEENIEPQLHASSRLIPQDQYFLHFHSLRSLGRLLDATGQWGQSLLRLGTVRAQDHQALAKLESQLCLHWNGMATLFDEGVVRGVALTGADPFVLEGTDVTLVLAVADDPRFMEATAAMLEAARNAHPAMVSRTFNYREHEVAAHYTTDRLVSSFVTRHDGHVIYSTSHRAIRRVIDVAVGLSGSLADAKDYHYVTTILPPDAAENTGYFFASEAFLKSIVGPAAKISQKRRLQCFNNLVMLNNASLLYRLENNASPDSLSSLIEGRYIDSRTIVCPHGGSYAIDADRDMCTCSLHNRLRYLTPNVELSVLKVSADEAAEYERYRQRYEQFWQKVFDPLAIRVTVDEAIRFEACVLPFANGSLYRDLRSMVANNALPIDTARIAPSALVSTVFVPGRERIATYLRAIPGVADVLRNDPTLTDMQWVGDRVGLHFCDGEMILQLDPAEISATGVPMIGDVPVQLQVLVGALVAAANMPIYLTVDVENREQAARLLEQMSQHVFLEESVVMPGVRPRFDAYRLPNYRDHAVYVFSGQLYALKIRLHVALVGGQLVAATKPDILREAIDASENPAGGLPQEAHLLVRLNLRALDRLRDDLRLYWAEKSRTACHRNISSIYNLCKLYDIPASDVSKLAMAKYGVTYFCPDGGDYAFDSERDRVGCSVHGNRLESRQVTPAADASSFDRFMQSLDEIAASLRFRDDALIATVKIMRSDQ